MSKRISTIGMVGLGALGLTAARRLMEAGYPVVGYRRSAMDDFAAAGGTPAASSRAVAEAADVVITILPNTEAVEEVVCGPAGIAEAARPGLVVAEMSTLRPADKSRIAAALAEKGAVMLDGAISGPPSMMAEGKAGVFVGGERDAFDRIAPVLGAIAPKTTYTGGFGTASALKLIANLLVPIHVLAAAEAFAIGERAGLDRKVVHEALAGTPASSAMFEARGKLMADRDYDRPGSMKGFMHSVDLVGELAADLGGDYPLLNAVTRAYREAIEADYGNIDQAVIVEWLMGNKLAAD